MQPCSGSSPNLVLSSAAFLKKKKKKIHYSQVSYTPGFANHLFGRNMGEIWLLKKFVVSVFPRDLEDFSVPDSVSF